MLKTVVLHNIFVETWYILFFRIHRWIESSKEQHLFEIAIFCNIINVFTDTFGQYDISMINKSNNLFQKINLTDIIYTENQYKHFSAIQ